MYLRIFFILIILFSGRTITKAQYGEKISLLKPISSSAEYLLATEAIQLFTANAPHIHKLFFRTSSEGELAVRFYRAENSFGQFKLIDENNLVFSKKISVRSHALSELSLPDSVVFNVGRKYFIRISSNAPFIIYVKDGCINGEQLYLDNSLLPDKSLDFELHTGYGRKRAIPSLFQTSALFWKDGFMNRKSDSSGLQPDGIVFKADVAFLKSLSLDLSIPTSGEGYAELFEFDIKQKKPVYYTKVSYPIKIEQDTTGRVLLDWQRQEKPLPFLHVGKYYFLSWKFKDKCRFLLREKRKTSVYEYIPEDLSVLCNVEGHDYFIENTKESESHPLIEKDTIAVFKYKPSLAYVNSFVIKNPSGSRGFLNIYKEDTSGKILLYKLNFNKQNKAKEIRFKSVYSLSLEVAGTYLFEVDYDSVSTMDNTPDKKELSLLELFGCNKYNDDLVKISATKCQEPFVRNSAHWLKTLSSYDINWLSVDIPEEPSDKFMSEMKAFIMQTASNRMGLIMNICLDVKDSIDMDSQINFLENYARKNISRKVIFNFYSRSKDLKSYETFLIRLKNTAGRLRTIESTFILGETLHDSLLSNVSWQALFRKYILPVQLFTFYNSYDVQKNLSLKRFALEAYSQIDKTVLPRTLFDYSALKEYSVYDKNAFNKVYDNYAQESVSHSTSSVFNIPVSIKRYPEYELSEMTVKLKAALCGPFDKPLLVRVSVIQKDTLSKTFSLNKIDCDSIIRFHFAIPSGFKLDEKLTLKAEFGKEITLYGVKENTGIGDESSLVIPCMSVAVRSKEANFKHGQLQSVKGYAIGQMFISERETIKGMILYCDQFYKKDIALSLYEFGTTESPRGKPLIEGLLPRNDIEIDHCNYYNISLSDCQEGKRYYLEFTRNGKEVALYRSVETGADKGSLACGLIYSYINNEGTVNLPSRQDDSLANSLYYSEIFNTRLIQNIMLQQGSAGYIFSRAMSGIDRWHEKDHYGLMVQSVSEDSIIRHKQYLTKFYELNTFLKDCEVSPYPSPVKIDQKEYDEIVFYQPDSKEIRIIIWNKNTLTPFEIEDVVNLHWSIPDYAKSISIKYEGKDISTFNNSLDVVMHGEPLFIVLKLKDGYMPE